MPETEPTVLPLKTSQREETRDGGGQENTLWAAHLFPLLSRSIAFPITRDLVSSSCTSSSSVFLQVCLALEQKKQTGEDGM